MDRATDADLAPALELEASDTERARRKDTALQLALAAVEKFYNGVIADRDAEIVHLRVENERLAALATSRFRPALGGEVADGE